MASPLPRVQQEKHRFQVVARKVALRCRGDGDGVWHHVQITVPVLAGNRVGPLPEVQAVTELRGAGLMVGSSHRVSPCTANGAAVVNNGVVATLSASPLQESPVHLPTATPEERRLSRRRDIHYLCYNITSRRAAGAVSLVTMVIACAVVGVSVAAVASVLTDDERCHDEPRELKHSCLSLLKTSRIVHFLTLTDGAALLLAGALLSMGVVKESAGLLVPYLMWVKMSASVGVVVVIFLSTNYRLTQVGSQLLFHLSLMTMHGICFHVVHQYDTHLMREMMSTSSVMLVPAG